MRISDNRYDRDMRRYSLGLRLIRLGARMQTIVVWTGLSMYRIRTLYRAYGTDHCHSAALRPRGRPFHQLNFFWRTATVTNQAAVLAGIARLLNIVPANPARDAFDVTHSLQRAEDVCGAYELFRSYMPETTISIDHAFLLFGALAQGDEVRIGYCSNCEGLILVDCLKRPRQICAFCNSTTKKPF